MRLGRKNSGDSIIPVLVVHLIYRLDVGGMENGLVNLINKLPADRYRHAIICLTIATEFRQRIERADVEIIECRKPPGKHLPTYWRVFRELRRLCPDIVHTRNLGTIDMNWIAWLARCPRRIHGEHGWSPDDPKGGSGKYRRLRRLCDPAVGQYVAVSQDIRRWLIDVIGIAESKVQTLHNGVDTDRFYTTSGDGPAGGEATTRVTFGTLGRQEPIKGLVVFLAAVHDLLKDEPVWRKRIRVIIAGDGPERRQYMAMCEEYGLEDVIEFPGNVTNVPKLLSSFDFFVQPSLNEGISNTVLEAMASGLPVIATNVGGNPELVRVGREGLLVPAGDAGALRSALGEYLADANLRGRHGQAARKRAEEDFSIEVMVRNYECLYRENFPGQPTATTV